MSHLLRSGRSRVSGPLLTCAAEVVVGGGDGMGWVETYRRSESRDRFRSQDRLSASRRMLEAAAVAVTRQKATAYLPPGAI